MAYNIHRINERNAVTNNDLQAGIGVPHTRFKVLLLCQGEHSSAPEYYTSETDALKRTQTLALTHNKRGPGAHSMVCKAVVVMETTDGSRTEYVHVASFVYQRLLGEDIAYREGE